MQSDSRITSDLVDVCGQPSRMASSSTKRPPNDAGRGLTMKSNWGYETNRRTRPALGAGERWRNERCRVEGLKLCRGKYKQLDGRFDFGNFNDWSRHKSAAGQLANAAVLVGSILLTVLVIVLPILSCLKPCMMHMLMHACIVLRVMCVHLRNMTVASHGFHGNRNCQCITAEQRQPHR